MQTWHDDPKINSDADDDDGGGDDDDGDDDDADDDDDNGDVDDDDDDDAGDDDDGGDGDGDDDVDDDGDDDGGDDDDDADDDDDGDSNDLFLFCFLGLEATARMRSSRCPSNWMVRTQFLSVSSLSQMWNLYRWNTQPCWFPKRSRWMHQFDPFIWNHLVKLP